MKYGYGGGIIKGIGYVLRGLAAGRKVRVLVGVAMILIRLMGRSRRTGIAHLVLEKGRSAAFRVTGPGSDPVSFRVDRTD